MILEVDAQGASSFIRGIILVGDETVSLTFETDYISSDQISFPIEPRSDGSFEIEFEISESLPGKLSIGQQEYLIFIHPHDTLQIVYSIEDQESPSYSGIFSAESEHLNNQKDGIFDDIDISKQMILLDPEDFGEYLSSRRTEAITNFKRTALENGFSNVYKQFGLHQIDYTFGKHLLEYRIAHKLVNQDSSNPNLTSAYYERLNQIVINNDQGFSSPAYRQFLKNYAKLIDECEKADFKLPTETNFIITSKTSPLFDQPDAPPIKFTLKKGDIVKYLNRRSDFKTKSRIGGEITENYWHEVEIPGGQKGWLLANTFNILSKTSSKGKQAVRREEKIIRKVAVKAYSLYEALPVFNDPNERKIIAQLPYGQEVEFANVTTTEDLNYTFQGISRLGRFAMIEFDGTVGWVFEPAIKKQQEIINEIDRRNVITLAALKRYSHYDQYLSGQSLYFAIATNLIETIKSVQSESIKADFQNFLSICPIAKINSVVKSHYESYFGRSLSYKMEEYQMVRLIETHAQKDASLKIARSFEINESFEVIDDYVVLPDLPTTILSAPSQINLDNCSSCTVSMVSDILTEAYKVVNSFNNNGQTQITVDLEQNSFAKLNDAKNSFILYLTPGAQISILKHDNGVFEPTDLSKENKFLLSFQNTFKIRKNQISTKIRDYDQREFQTSVEGLSRQMQIFLKEFNSIHKLTDSFLIDMSYDIKYWKANQYLRYLKEHALYDKSWSLPNEESNFYSFLKEVDINPVGRNLGQNYRTFIQAYLKYFQNLPKNRNIPIEKLIETNFNGYSYYYLKAQHLRDQIFTTNLLIVGREIGRFIQLSPFQELNRSLVNTYNANLPLRVGKPVPDFHLLNIEGESISLNQFEGKIIVLDFWATWCGPCLEKMRSDIDLQTHFKESDVVFLYVSLDTDYDKWKRFLKANPAIKGIHAIPQLYNAFDSQIARNYKIQSIPAFYIIGKDGKLAYKPFTTLSPRRIRDYIDELLYPR